MASLKRVLLLRVPREDSDEQDPYQQLFMGNGIDVSSISPLSFDFINLQTLAADVRQPSDFSGLVFTSARTVQAVDKCIGGFCDTGEWQSKLHKDWSMLPAYTVGSATALATRDLGLTPVGQEAGNAVNLVKIIQQGISPGSKPLLIPRGQLAREELLKRLKKADIDFKVDIVYETICNPSMDEAVESFFETAIPDALVFFSPSGVRFSANVLKNLGTSKTKLVSIGPTTTSAMEEQGYTVDATSAKPNPETLLRTILDLGDKVL